MYNNTFMLNLVIVGASTLLLAPSRAYTDEIPANARNPQAVADVSAGKRAVANAAWWGFDEDDATDSLQAAIDSGAKRVLVPNMTKEWIVRPIKLVGEQELVLEDGVVITAKRGEFRGRGDMLFYAENVVNLTIRGYGATLRMQKADYISGKVLKDLGWERWFGPYEKAEWRMGLGLRGCTNVKVLGLTIRDTGGDGIYVDGSGKRKWSQNILIRDVICDNNYRQGISIISVDGLTVENSVFRNTWGTPPSSGVDIEPDAPEYKLKNIVFRDCLFADNYGDGIEVFLSHLNASSDDVSILFERCRVTSKWGSGIRVSKIADDGPNGLIEFRNCTVEHTEAFAIKVQDKSADRARVRFVKCIVRDSARNKNYRGAWAPIWLQFFRPNRMKTFGGIDFIDCLVEDERNRPVLVVERAGGAKTIRDITGTLTVRNPHGVRSQLKTDPDKGVTLTVSESP